MKHFIVLLIISITFLSCRSTRTLKKEFGNDLNSSFAPINLLFNNTDSLKTYKQSLLHVLTDNGKNKQDTLANWDKISVKIITTEKKIKIQGYLKDSLVFETERKGKTKENYFKIKRKTHWFGFPILFWSYYESLILLKTDAQGNLLVARSVQSVGGLIFFIAGNDYSNLYQFTKITN